VLGVVLEGHLLHNALGVELLLLFIALLSLHESLHIVGRHHAIFISFGVHLGGL